MLILSGMSCGSYAGQEPTPQEVKAITQKVADWQIATFDERAKYRAISSDNKAKAEKTGKPTPEQHELEWHNGALYAGMDHWRKVADNPDKYTDFLKTIGERHGWIPHKRPYHADDHAVGQMYLSLYQDFNDPAMIGPIKERFDWILANRKTGSLEWTGSGGKPKTTDCSNRWGWCDALFMAPPVWARLAKITGENKYLEFMDEEYHASYDLLWSKKDKLFFRDTRYFTQFEKNGNNIYWARGNGWVFGGLGLMIPDLPEDWEGRSFYIDLLKDMAESAKNCQREDGTWSAGLLGGVEAYPLKETSGTSFLTFGLAWGVNNGVLDRATYEPVIFKAWNALIELVNEEGMLTYVQPVGSSPEDSYPDKTEVYGLGAFLAAGTEVYKLVGGK